jgi:hypothetical protein
MGKSIKKKFVTAQERNEIRREIQQEERVEKSIDLHHASRKKHIDQNEHLRKHHYGVAEFDPTYLMILFFIIVHFKLRNALAVCPAEFDDMKNALNDKQKDTC